MIWKVRGQLVLNCQTFLPYHPATSSKAQAKDVEKLIFHLFIHSFTYWDLYETYITYQEGF